MGIMSDAVTQLIGTPTNYMGELIFLMGEFLLTVLIIGGILVIFMRLVTRH